MLIGLVLGWFEATATGATGAAATACVAVGTTGLKIVIQIMVLFGKSKDRSRGSTVIKTERALGGPRHDCSGIHYDQDGKWSSDGVVFSCRNKERWWYR